MSQYVPEITTEGLKQVLTRGDDALKKMQCTEVIGKDGSYIGTLIIPNNHGGMTIYDDIFNHAEALSVRSNSVFIFEEPEEPDTIAPVIDEKPVEPVDEDNVTVEPLPDTECPYCDFIAHSATGLMNHIRAKHKKEG